MYSKLFNFFLVISFICAASAAQLKRCNNPAPVVTVALVVPPKPTPPPVSRIETGNPANHWKTVNVSTWLTSKTEKQSLSLIIEPSNSDLMAPELAMKLFGLKSEDQTTNSFIGEVTWARSLIFIEEETPTVSYSSNGRNTEELIKDSDSPEMQMETTHLLLLILEKLSVSMEVELLTQLLIQVPHKLGLLSLHKNKF